VSTLLQNPTVRYGLGVAEAALLVAVAVVFLDPGTVRWAVLAVAGTSLVTTPWVLEMAAEQAETDGEDTETDDPAGWS